MPHGTLAQVAQTSYMKGEFLYLSFIIMSIINIQGGSQLSLLEIIGIIGLIILISLNPCCAGRCSSTEDGETFINEIDAVSILVVLDDALVLEKQRLY